MASNFIGSRISLVSKSEIRYKGTLVAIDHAAATISLQKVQSMGTEGRRGDSDIPPSETIYDFIVFKAADVKNLQVEQPPAAPTSTIPDDPAIVGTARPSPKPTQEQPAQVQQPAQQPQQAQQPQPHPGTPQRPFMGFPPAGGPFPGYYPPPHMFPPGQVPHPAYMPYAGDRMMQPPSQQPPQAVPQPAPQPVLQQPQQPSQQQPQQPQRQPQQVSQTTIDEPEGPIKAEKIEDAMSRIKIKDETRVQVEEVSLSNKVDRPRRRRERNGHFVPKSDFDFESSNAVFRKIQKNPAEEEGELEIDAQDLLNGEEEEDTPYEEVANVEESKPAYNKSNSFFDSLSSVSNHQTSREIARAAREEERSRNMSTFGEATSASYRGRGRGRGAYRGNFRGRGNYRGGYRGGFYDKQ